MLIAIVIAVLDSSLSCVSFAKCMAEPLRHTRQQELEQQIVALFHYSVQTLTFLLFSWLANTRGYERILSSLHHVFAPHGLQTHSPPIASRGYLGLGVNTLVWRKDTQPIGRPFVRGCASSQRRTKPDTKRGNSNSINEIPVYAFRAAISCWVTLRLDNWCTLILGLSASQRTDPGSSFTLEGKKNKKQAAATVQFNFLFFFIVRHEMNMTVCDPTTSSATLATYQLTLRPFAEARHRGKTK